MHVTIYNNYKFGVVFVCFVSNQFQNQHLVVVNHVSIEQHGTNQMFLLHLLNIRMNHIVLANTKRPSLSRMHISIPNLFMKAEKEASMLHFNLPRIGFFHLCPHSCWSLTYSADCSVTTAAFPNCMFCCCCFLLAVLQSSSKCLALLTILEVFSSFNYTACILCHAATNLDSYFYKLLYTRYTLIIQTTLS